MQPCDTDELYQPPSDSTSLTERYSKLQKVRNNLVSLYHEEFLKTLIHQATNESDRFKPVPHKAIKPGDIVLLDEKFSKRYGFPMPRVVSTEVNDLGEVTAARVFKGNSRETVYRHASSLIPLLSVDSTYDPSPPVQPQDSRKKERPKRVRLKLLRRGCACF